MIPYHPQATKSVPITFFGAAFSAGSSGCFFCFFFLFFFAAKGDPVSLVNLRFLPRGLKYVIRAGRMAGSGVSERERE